MLRTGGVRFLLAIVALLACAPAAAACAPDSGPNLSNRVVTTAALTKYSSLECANFQHADLRGISFLQADLKVADFRHAVVTGDDFSQATLQDSNFYGAQAAGANFGQAMMQYANLRDANLQGADFIQTYLEHATLGGSNTSDANFTQADTYDSTGVPSGSGSGSLTAIIFVVVGLLVGVPILITILRLSKARGNPPRFIQSKPRLQPVAAQNASAAVRFPAGAPTDPVDQLSKVADLHDRGELTDAEFAAEKARILGEH